MAFSVLLWACADSSADIPTDAPIDVPSVQFSEGEACEHTQHDDHMHTECESTWQCEQLCNGQDCEYIIENEDGSCEAEWSL